MQQFKRDARYTKNARECNRKEQDTTKRANSREYEYDYK